MRYAYVICVQIFGAYILISGPDFILDLVLCGLQGKLFIFPVSLQFKLRTWTREHPSPLRIDTSDSWCLSNLILSSIHSLALLLSDMYVMHQIYVLFLPIAWFSCALSQIATPFFSVTPRSWSELRRNLDSRHCIIIHCPWPLVLKFQIPITCFGILPCSQFLAHGWSQRRSVTLLDICQNHHNRLLCKKNLPSVIISNWNGKKTCKSSQTVLSQNNFLGLKLRFCKGNHKYQVWWGSSI